MGRIAYAASAKSEGIAFGVLHHCDALRMMKLYKVRVQPPVRTQLPERGDALFLDGVRLAHLGTEVAVKTEAEDPRSLSVAHLPVTSPPIGSVCARDSGSPVQVQVGSYPRR